MFITWFYEVIVIDVSSRKRGVYMYDNSQEILIKIKSMNTELGKDGFYNHPDEGCNFFIALIRSYLDSSEQRVKIAQTLTFFRFFPGGENILHYACRASNSELINLCIDNLLLPEKMYRHSPYTQATHGPFKSQISASFCLGWEQHENFIQQKLTEKIDNLQVSIKNYLTNLLLFYLAYCNDSSANHALFPKDIIFVLYHQTFAVFMVLHPAPISIAKLISIPTSENHLPEMDQINFYSSAP